MLWLLPHECWTTGVQYHTERLWTVGTGPGLVHTTQAFYQMSCFPSSRTDLFWCNFFRAEDGTQGLFHVMCRCCTPEIGPVYPMNFWLSVTETLNTGGNSSNGNLTISIADITI